MAWHWTNGSLVSDEDEVILWATYDKNLTSYIGVMADYEDLIPAAPDLLAACERMLEDLEKNINPMLEDFGMHPLTLSVRDLKAAIAKARGDA